MKSRILFFNVHVRIFLLFLPLINGCSPTGTKDPASPDDSVHVSFASLFKTENLWMGPDTNLIPPGDSGSLIQYGRQLIAQTSHYFGPEGSIGNFTNGMNCQNCHLNAGSKPFGNNYSAVASTYPKFRARSGGMESIEKRVNDCLTRSLNGHSIDSLSREMRAIVAYIKWLGKDVKKGEVPAGSGLVELSLLDRPADPERGKIVFMNKCISCHGTDGAGKPDSVSPGYLYPPLWGEHSYNTGAGLFRLSRFAGYIKANMPFGASYDKPQLSDEEAWDLAAFINSQPRPEKKFKQDWPEISKKPYDHPFGPYADTFTETQHKYGPFAQIQAARKKK